MARHVAYATRATVSVRDSHGEIIAYRFGNYAGPQKQHRGVNLDAADMDLEDMGYTAGTWRWNEEYGAWKAVAFAESQLRR